MMRYEEGNLADTKPCAGIRADLKMCLLESDCCKIDRKTPRECLKEKTCPPKCLALQNTFFECKRSLLVFRNYSSYNYMFLLQMLDNRQRFRGRKGY